MLAKRVFVSIIIMAAWFGVIFFLPAWWLYILCGLFMILGLVDFFDLARNKGIFIHR